MEMIGYGLLAIGVIICLIGGIMLLVKAFQESVGWGLASLLVPLVLIVFVVTHWGECAKPFFIYLVGFVMLVIGSALSMNGVQVQPSTGY